jgi:DNA-binding response OmpR family regulator
VRILVVDDDVRLRDLLTRYLTGQGFDVRAIPGRARPRQAACSATRPISSCST